VQPRQLAGLCGHLPPTRAVRGGPGRASNLLEVTAGARERGGPPAGPAAPAARPPRGGTGRRPAARGQYLSLLYSPPYSHPYNKKITRGKGTCEVTLAASTRPAQIASTLISSIAARADGEGSEWACRRRRWSARRHRQPHVVREPRCQGVAGASILAHRLVPDKLLTGQQAAWMRELALEERLPNTQQATLTPH
jgi:hypothetical protein